MKTLFLHIGHGKTGSSWIQNSLAMSCASLARQGILYPPPPGGFQGGPLSITIGNGFGILDDVARITLPPGSEDKSALFSNEHLMHQMYEKGDLNFLSRAARQAGYERMSVLLFIRNPVSHASSGFQQAVKRSGYIGTLEDKFREFPVPEYVHSLLLRLDELGTYCEYTVLNYGKWKNNLVEKFEAWLDVPGGTITPAGNVRVNRSLSRAELLFQLVLNRSLGRNGQLLADSLCERLPDIKSDMILPDVRIQEEMCDRLQPAMDGVNAMISRENRYKKDIVDSVSDGGPLVFDERQIELIATVLGSEIARLQDRCENSQGISGRKLLNALTSKIAWRLTMR